MTLAFESIHQAEADAIVFPLDGRDFRTEPVLQGFVLVRQHFHTLLVDQEIFQMVQDEDADSLLGFIALVETPFEFFKDGCEGVFLNQVQQAFFRSEVVIQARQRHA